MKTNKEIKEAIEAECVLSCKPDDDYERGVHGAGLGILKRLNL